MLFRANCSNRCSRIGPARLKKPRLEKIPLDPLFIEAKSFATASCVEGIRLHLRRFTSGHGIATDAFGNALGNSIAGNISQGAQQTAVLSAATSEANPLGSGLRVDRTGLGLAASARDIARFDEQLIGDTPLPGEPGSPFLSSTRSNIVLADAGDGLGKVVSDARNTVSYGFESLAKGYNSRDRSVMEEPPTILEQVGGVVRGLRNIILASPRFPGHHPKLLGAHSLRSQSATLEKFRKA